MTRSRRSSAEVVDQMLVRLAALEKEKALLEKAIKTATNPMSLLMIIKVRIIMDAIATIIRAIRRRNRKRRKAK